MIDRLEAAIRTPKRSGMPALMPYVTSGYPTREGFVELLRAVGRSADAIEVGVPFSDPMADGPTIQASSRVALENGVSLSWILEAVAHAKPDAPMALMSYLNPLLAYGLERLVRDAADAGISGFIVPDMPWEEGAAFREAAESQGLGQIQLVTPVTPTERLKMLCEGSRGFVYAVTMTGITGKDLRQDISSYLNITRQYAAVPVCAGFGIRKSEDVGRLSGSADGVIVGSAFIEAIGAGQRPETWLNNLMRCGR